MTVFFKILALKGISVRESNERGQMRVEMTRYHFVLTASNAEASVWNRWSLTRR